VTTACADARQDETLLGTALTNLDEATARAVVERGRYDPVLAFTWALGQLRQTYYDAPQLDLLVRVGAPVNVKNRLGRTAITHEWMTPTYADLLVSAGADLEARDGACLTPLMRHIQSSQHNTDICPRLISLGANVNAITPNHNTALLFAVSTLYGGPVLALLEAGADANARNLAGSTSLTQSVRSSRPEFIRLLVAHDADINSLGPQGEPFWVYALVDNMGASTISPDDDDVLEWVFTHPDLHVDLSATGATDALAKALSWKYLVHYVSYLQARAASDPSLHDGELLGVFDRSELRMLDGRLRKNGLDITPPKFVLTGRPRIAVNSDFFFLLEQATLRPGSVTVASAPMDWSRASLLYDAALWRWHYAMNGFNIYGVKNLAINGGASKGGGYFEFTGYETGYSAIRTWTVSLNEYSRPYGN
jgi:hypothetical protein